MGYSTYLFDFDYTLADSSKGILTCFRNVLTKHGYTDVTDDEIKHTIGQTLEESFSILTKVTDKGQLETFRKEYVKEADTYMTSNTVLFLETKSVLRALKDAGALIGIISTKYRYRIKELLDQHLPEDFFNMIIGGEDVTEAKPSPEGILLAMKHLHVSKEETLYIGDSIVDAKAAEAAGVDFAGVLHGVTTTEELSQYPHVKIMSTLEGLLENEQSPLTTSSKEKRKKKRKGSGTNRPWKQILKRSAIAGVILLAILAVIELFFAGTYLFLIILLIILLSSAQKWNAFSVMKRLAPKPTSKCEAYARLFHARQIHGHPAGTTSQNITTCLNCNNTYTGDYCNHCGQSRKISRLSFRHGVKNIFGGLSHMEHGFWGTLIELLYRPGYMIGDFIKGKRVHYLGPFHALFLLAAIYILLVKFVDPSALNEEEKSKEARTEQVNAVRDRIQQRLDTTQNVQQKAALVQLQRYLSEDSIQMQQSKIKEAGKGKTKQSKVLPKDFMDAQSDVSIHIKQKLNNFPLLGKVWDLLHHWAHGNKAASIILTLPVFALATRMAFRRRTYLPLLNSTEHLFIQAYIAAQILLISCLYFPFNGKAQLNDLYDIPYWAIFIVFWWDYKQLFRSTWLKAFTRTILMFLYSLLIIILIAIILVAIIVGGIYLLRAIGF